MIRLGLGYFGNLAERVPWLLGFWMLSLFPQPLIMLYFIVVQARHTVNAPHRKRATP